jgi:hypothetical protein
VTSPPLPPELEKFRAVSEKVAAEIIGCQPMTLANWRCQGRGPEYLKIFRSIKYPLAGLLAWRDQYRVTPEDGAGR